MPSYTVAVFKVCESCLVRGRAYSGPGLIVTRADAHRYTRTARLSFPRACGGVLDGPDAIYSLGAETQEDAFVAASLHYQMDHPGWAQEKPDYMDKTDTVVLLPVLA